jgi:drug/metabolite transporter (DMT)-like permease
MSGAANLAPSLLALSAAFCFAVGLILTPYGLRTVPSCRVGSIALVAPLVTLFPLMAVVLSYVFLSDERLHALGLLGILTSVAGVILLLAGT